MSDNSAEKRNVKNDEIDLLDLFNRIARWISRSIKTLWIAFLISIVFLLKRWLPLTISIILALGVSFYMMKTTPSLFTSDMVLKNNVIPNDQLISYINRLQSLDKGSLAKTLGISEVTSKNIAFIGSYWIIDKNNDKIPDNVDYTNTHDVYDTTNVRMRDRVNVSVTIITPQDLGAVRDGIVKYIETNPIFMKMNEMRRSHNEDLLQRTILDINNLDSLQKVKYFEESRDKMKKTGGQIILYQEQPAQMFYNDLYSLYGRKASLEDNLNLYNGIVSVLNDFSVPTMRVNSLYYYLKRVVPPFVITMLIFLIIIANAKRLKEVYNKY